jgi:hypothetical protein
MIEPVELPKWSGRAPAKVAEYDAANAETAEIATEMETRASKIISYVNDWELQHGRAKPLAHSGAC